jgi:membrane protein DedA with SNARE-associated domain
LECDTVGILLARVVIKTQPATGRGGKHLSLESLLQDYGYLAVLIGTFLEGETILLLGGVAAQLGYLELSWVIVHAFVGTLVGDQLYYFLGKHHGRRFLQKFPTLHSRTLKVFKLLKRQGIWLILSYRFLYGLRTVASLVLGMSNVSTRLFTTFNAVGALVWAITLGSVGYVFGHAIEAFVANLKRFELQLVFFLMLAAVLTWIILFYRRRYISSRAASKN